jgi:outer membrane protein
MKKILLYILVLLPQLSVAQVPFTLKNAIDTALQNNFDIQIARNITEINKLSNTYGVAGGLPSINATAGDNNTLYNLKQKLSNGTDITKNSVRSNTYNGSLTAGIILFNGFKVTATKGKLNSLFQQSELQLNVQIQNIIAAVMVNYYDILRQQGYLNIIKSSLDVSTKKLDIIKERNKVGMSNEADLLQAEIDLNLAEQNIKSQELIIDQDKISLLQLMSARQFSPISIDDTILVDESLSRDDIIKYLEKNPQYLSSEQQIKINEQIVKEIKSQRYPSIRINTGYNFTYSSSTAGFNLFTQNYGPSVGATLLIPIFNGNVYKVQQEVARFNVNNAKLQKESLLTSLKAEAIKTYQAYENTLQQLKMQKTNYENAGRLVAIVVKRFQLNQATILDVKAAQNSFEDSGYMFINLLYAAKVSEIDLKRLVYRLGN